MTPDYLQLLKLSLRPLGIVVGFVLLFDLAASELAGISVLHPVVDALGIIFIALALF